MNEHAKRLAEIRLKLAGTRQMLAESRIPQERAFQSAMYVTDVAFLLQTIDDPKSSGEAAIRSMVVKPGCNCDVCQARSRRTAVMEQPLPRPLTEAEIGLLKRLAEGTLQLDMIVRSLMKPLMDMRLADWEDAMPVHDRRLTITDRGRAVLSGEVAGCYVKVNTAGVYELCGEEGHVAVTRGTNGLQPGWIRVGPMPGTRNMSSWATKKLAPVEPSEQDLYGMVLGHIASSEYPWVPLKKAPERSPCGECCPPTGPIKVSYRDVEPDASRISFGTGDESPPWSDPDEDTEIDDFPEPLEPPDMDELGEAGARDEALERAIARHAPPEDDPHTNCSCDDCNAARRLGLPRHVIAQGLAFEAAMAERDPARHLAAQERKAGVVHFAFNGVACEPGRDPQWVPRSGVPREVTCCECLKVLPALVAEPRTKWPRQRRGRGRVRVADPAPELPSIFSQRETFKDGKLVAYDGRAVVQVEESSNADVCFLPVGIEPMKFYAFARTAPPIAPANLPPYDDGCSDPKPNVVTDDNEADVRPQEPVCVCESPTMHEPDCAWAIWRKKARE